MKFEALRTPTRLAALTFAILGAASNASAQLPCGTSGWCHLEPRTPSFVAIGTQSGHAVAIEAGLAAVTELGSHTVVIHERIGATWEVTGELHDPNPGNNSFGLSVAVSDQFVVVGAPFDSTFATHSGAAHVWRRTPAGLVFEQTLYSSTPFISGNFGYAVDVDGQWLGVGEPGNMGGLAHVHLRTLKGWVRLSGVTSYFPDSVSLGSSIAVTQTANPIVVRVAVGDPGCSASGHGAGRVSLASVSPWAHISTFIDPPTPLEDSAFGFRLAYEGTQLLVGSPYSDEVGQQEGSVDLFDVTLDGVELVVDHEQHFVPCLSGIGPGHIFGQQFGRSLGLSGGRIAIGSPYLDFGPSPGGAVHVFKPNAFGTAYVGEDLVYAQGGAADDDFGFSLGLDGDMLLVGARGVDLMGPFSGASYFASLAPKAIAGGACPCDELASVDHYGVGKPGVNGVPVIGASSSAIPGQTVTIAVSNSYVGATPIIVWGAVPTALPFDGGTILIQDLHLDVMPTIGGTGKTGIAWHVPPQADFCGVDVYVQAFIFDPTASGVFKYASTDGLHLLVGY